MPIRHKVAPSYRQTYTRTMMVGETVGGYRLVERRGVGGTGTVWLAQDSEGQYVALKLLHPAVAADPVSAERLMREARTVNSVQSDGVAHVLDLELEEAQPFIVSEFVEGSTLADVLKEGALTRLETLQCAWDLSQVIEDVHAAGIVHRDIKPGNIIMSARGPVLIDFGIAQGGDDLALTAQGFVTGTAAYASPEILRGQRADEDSDWWAWAVTVVQMLTGRSPFGSGTTESVINRVLSGEVDVDGLPLRVQSVFRQFFGQDQSERMSPAELLALLDLPSSWDEAADAGQTVVMPQMETSVLPVQEVAAAGAMFAPTRMPAAEFEGQQRFPGYGVGNVSAGVPTSVVGEALAESERFNQVAPPSMPILVVSLLVALALLPVFSGWVGVQALAALVGALSLIGGFSRSLRLRRLRAMGVRPSDWWVTLARTPLILLRVVVALFFGSVVGVLAAVAVAAATWVVLPADLQGELLVEPWGVPQALMESVSSPAVVEVTSSLRMALLVYVVVVVFLFVVWLLPSGRALNEGIAVFGRLLFPVVWIRAIVVVLIFGAVVFSWWLPVKSFVFFW